MKVAIVYDWLTQMRGGERCLEVFCELFPQADLYTLLHIPGACSETIERMKIHASFIQKMPYAYSKYRSYLPLFPFAIERFNLKDYELVFSSSHCVAKGVIPGPEATHICYIYTPMRYIWDMFDEYFSEEKVGRVQRGMIQSVATFLRTWDAASSDRVDHFIAISRHVQKRVMKYYRRDSQLLHPPVDTSFFQPGGQAKDYYLTVSGLVPYKRIELAIHACNQLKRNLLIIGTGPEASRLARLARHPGIRFLGYQDQEALRKYYQECRALIFPGEEDFGIAPVEAMSCGRPVIAYGRGGALDTVETGESGNPTGVLFQEQSTQALVQAILEFEKSAKEFNPQALRSHAQTFDRSLFKSRLDAMIKQLSGQ